MMTVEPGWVEQLYVDPQWRGRGLGDRFVELAKQRQPGGLELWTFQVNTPACRFYERHGFVEVERTDGAGNEEHVPDLRMVWEGRDPVAFLRAQVDEADADLAAVLARRAALTARIQEHKAVGGHDGRDPAREEEIVQRLAARAPALGVRGWRRVVDAVITASLEAAERGR
jgi:chorismate mutase